MNICKQCGHPIDLPAEAALWHSLGLPEEHLGYGVLGPARAGLGIGCYAHSDTWQCVAAAVLAQRLEPC